MSSKNSLEQWHRQTIPDIFPQTYLDVAKDHGLDVDDLIKRSKIDIDKLNAKQNRLTMYDLEMLAFEIIQRIGVNGLGLDIGWRMPPTAFGTVGYALLCSPTLKDAINVCEKYWLMIGKGMIFNVYDEKKHCVVELSPRKEAPELFHNIMIESALTSFQRGFEILLGDDARGAEIWFPFPEPEYSNKITEVFGESVYFDMPSGQYRVPIELLDHTVAMSNATGFELAIAQCEQELIKLGLNELSLVQQVQALLTLDETGYPDLENVAERLNLTPRTLRRHLSSEGTTYTDILNTCCRRDAIHLLANRGLSIQAIAEMLGYTDPANFTRAFKQWTGISPSHYRKTRLNL